MKKIIAFLLAVTIIASMAIVASAAETTLTTTVPAASYTLNVPAVVPIDFGATETDIGSITVTDASGFAEGKNLKVTVNYDAFKCENVTTTIPFGIRFSCESIPSYYRDIVDGGTITFLGLEDGTTNEYSVFKGANDDRFSNLDQTLIKIDSADWGKALAGEYTATITFTAEVVVEE